MTGGTVKSDPGYSLALDAEFVGTGNDYIHADPDNKHLRLNAHGVIKSVFTGDSGNERTRVENDANSARAGPRMRLYVTISVAKTEGCKLTV
jgi:hypothetical protein